MYIAKQSTTIDIALGPFLDEDDGKTAETSLTISQADVRLSKNGAAFAQRSASGNLSHMENGYYALPLSTTDTNTVGTLRVHVHESGALPVWVDIQIVEEAIYDALFAASATGLLPANVTQFGGSSGTFASGRPEVNVSHWRGTQPNTLQSGRVDSYVGAVASGVIAAASFAANALDAVWSTAARTLTAGTNIVLAKGTGITGFNDLSAAEVNAEVDSALADYDAPTHAELTSALGNLNDLSASDVRDAVGLASADLDTQLSDIANAIAGLNDIEAADVLNAVYEEAESVQDFLRLARAALVGLVTGAETTTIKFLGADETTERIVATVDTDGNRSAVTVDPD